MSLIFVAISIAVPVLLLVILPVVLGRFSPFSAHYLWLLVGACLLYGISWYLPSPQIDGTNTAFVTHFVGGGMFCGLLWFYLARSLNIKLHPFGHLAAIYFLTAGLGVANELAELVIVTLGYAQLNVVSSSQTDTWWDLAANTLGALTVWLLYATRATLKRTGSA